MKKGGQLLERLNYYIEDPDFNKQPEQGKHENLYCELPLDGGLFTMTGV